MLIQGLPKSVVHTNLSSNHITLARQLPLLRFKELYLSGNALSSDGPRVIAASLANQECRLDELYLNDTNIGDEGATTLAEGLRNNQSLIYMLLHDCNITDLGWNAFSSILCDAASINATYSSNHTLQSLGFASDIPQDAETMLELNSDEDKSIVAAKKILLAHRHLDMEPLFDRKLDLLPIVVAWIDRFAESRLDIKLSSVFDFVRAMPMEVVCGVAGKKKGKEAYAQ